jgi:hypothetical protein
MCPILCPLPNLTSRYQLSVGRLESPQTPCRARNSSIAVTSNHTLSTNSLLAFGFFLDEMHKALLNSPFAIHSTIAIHILWTRGECIQSRFRLSLCGKQGSQTASLSIAVVPQTIALENVRNGTATKANPSLQDQPGTDILDALLEGQKRAPLP